MKRRIICVYRSALKNPLKVDELQLFLFFFNSSYDKC